MSDLSAQNLTERQREIFGGEATVGPRDAWQPSRHQLQPTRPKFNLIAYLKSRKIRWWYVVIGAVDMGIGAVSFGASGHFPIIQMILGAFGMAATIGRVQAFRYAQSLKGKTEKTAISKRRLFYFAWGVGIFAATYFGLHFELAVIRAQDIVASDTNARTAMQTALVAESKTITERRPKYDKAVSDAIDREQWNSRDAYLKLIQTDSDRVKEIQRILENQPITVAVSAKAMFGLISGEHRAEFMAGVGFVSLHLFMELMLALFSSPLITPTVAKNQAPKRRKSRDKSRPDESII